MRLPALAAALMLPAAATAHPHIFIEAGMGFVIDEADRLTAVRVEWVYDEFYTLLLLEDLGLDPDGDMQLTEEELATLKAADSDWAPDYEGDLYGLADGQAVALAPPVNFDLRMEGGKIVSSHTRPLAVPLEVAGHDVRFQTYDPFYYAAFDLTLPVTVQGGGCGVERLPADRAGAKLRLEEAIRKLQASGEIEGQFPPVGAEFADTIRLTCGR